MTLEIENQTYRWLLQLKIINKNEAKILNTTTVEIDDEVAD